MNDGGVRSMGGTRARSAGALPAAFALAGVLMAACTNAPSNAQSGDAKAPPSGDVYTVSVVAGTVVDLPVCAPSLYGTTAYVQSPVSLYTCQAPGAWIAVPCLSDTAGAVA
jgi:hypothetical protein